MRYRNDTDSMRVTRSLALSRELVGGMVCIMGQGVGRMLSLESDLRMVVGRDDAVCDFTVPDPKVSRKHMEITYIGAVNQYRIVDYSKNGVFLKDGRRLEKNKEYYLPPKTEFNLGQGNNRYKLK